jgi:hypothetical protein
MTAPPTLSYDMEAALKFPAVATELALAVTAVRLVSVRHSSPTEVEQ